MNDDTKILEIALREMSQALDALIAECTGDDGKPKAPSHGSLMRSRGLLPPHCKQSFAKQGSRVSEGASQPAGLYTLRDAVARMFDAKSDTMEMYFIRDGKKWNIELRILQAEDID